MSKQHKNVLQKCCKHGTVTICYPFFFFMYFIHFDLIICGKKLLPVVMVPQMCVNFQKIQTTREQSLGSSRTHPRLMKIGGHCLAGRRRLPVNPASWIAWIRWFFEVMVFLCQNVWKGEFKVEGIIL